MGCRDCFSSFNSSTMKLCGNYNTTFSIISKKIRYERMMIVHADKLCVPKWIVERSSAIFFKKIHNIGRKQINHFQVKILTSYVCTAKTRIIMMPQLYINLIKLRLGLTFLGLTVFSHQTSWQWPSIYIKILKTQGAQR